MGTPLNTYRVKIEMAQGGKNSRNKSSLVFHANFAPDVTIANTAALVGDVSDVLSDVMLDSASIQRFTFTRMDSDGRAIPGDTLSVPVSVLGKHDIPAGGAAADEFCGVRIEKQAGTVRPAAAHLRYCLTADEFATFTETQVLPARFGALPTAAMHTGDNLEEALKAAFELGGMPLAVLSKAANGSYVSKLVESLVIGEAALEQTTRKRTNAQAEIARNTQRVLNEHYRRAKKLLDQYAGVTPPAEVVTAIRAIIAAAVAIYSSLDVLMRARIKYPAFALILAVLDALD